MNDASEVDIDRIDRKILAILQTDGRISNLRLAEQVALSPTAVQARVARLTRDGYILGYEARLNPQKLGVGMTVFVEVLLDRTTPHVFDEFKAAVLAYPAIMECHMVAGGLTICSRPAWPIWRPTVTLRAGCCGSFRACARPEPMR
jgi:Lrp/AsnC family leucine-responsive transcriptional regulator